MSINTNEQFYNRIQKERYLKAEQQYRPKVKFATLVFKRVQIFEEEFEKDVYNFSKTEIEEMYKRIGFLSYNTLSSYNYHLSWYTEWAINEGLVSDSQNHFLELEAAELDNLVNKAAVNLMILTREDVLRCVNNLVNPRDQYMVMAVFEFGKRNRYNDAANARIEDFDFENKVLHIPNGRDINVSEQLLEFATDSYNADSYLTIGKSGADREIPLIDNGTVIKMTAMALCDDQESRGERFYNSVHKVLKKSDYSYVTTNTLAVSGQVDMVKRRAVMYNMTVEDYLNNHKNEVEEQYGVKIIVKRFMEKYGNFL